MNREQAIALALELVTRNETPAQYAARVGVKYPTLLSAISRAGVRLAVEMRRLKVRAVEQAKAANPKLTYSRLAHEAGWSSQQAFCRARKSLALWDRA